MMGMQSAAIPKNHRYVEDKAKAVVYSNGGAGIEEKGNWPIMDEQEQR